MESLHAFMVLRLLVKAMHSTSASILLDKTMHSSDSRNSEPAHRPANPHYVPTFDLNSWSTRKILQKHCRASQETAGPSSVLWGPSTTKHDVSGLDVLS